LLPVDQIPAETRVLLDWILEGSIRLYKRDAERVGFQLITFALS
jgi:hypothetical protein